MNRIDMEKLDDVFTRQIASALHLFDNQDKINVLTCSAQDIIDLQGGYIERYRNDVLFNMKVKSLTARLISSVSEAELLTHWAQSQEPPE